MEHAVVVDNVTKKYGAVEALKGVSLTVPSGELFGIIGPDGEDFSFPYPHHLAAS